MKKNILLALFVLLVSSLHAQKIPFQGKLLEDGIPFTGSKDFTFSIDINGVVWTESHLGIAVSDGLYAVTLGSITPLPQNLFGGVDFHLLQISIGGTPLSPVELFPSINKREVVKDITGLPDSVGTVYELTGIKDISNTAWYQVALNGFANTDVGANVGVQGEAFSSGTNWAVGLRGSADGDGTGIRYGIRGEVYGTNSNWSVGGLGYNLTTPPDGARIIGLYGKTFYGGINTTSYAIYGRAQGIGGINIGVRGEADRGDENWAGWFEGDVMITGNLMTVNSPGMGGGIFGDNYDNGVTINDGAPKISMYSGGSGADDGILTIELNADDGSAFFDGDVTINGTLNSSGSTSDLFIDNFFGVGDIQDNAAHIDSNSISLVSGGDGSDNGLFVMSMTANNNGTNQWGALTLDASNNIQNTIIGSKDWEGPMGYARPFLAMRGSVQVDDGSGPYYPDLVWLEAQERGPGVETGAINFLSTEGNQFGMDAYGISGNGTGNFGNYQTDGVVLNDGAPTIQMYSNGIERISFNADDGSAYFDGDVTINGNLNYAGGGSSYNNIIIQDVVDGSQDFGSIELLGNGGDQNIYMGAKSWEDPIVGAQRPYMSMQGSINDENLVWMEAYERAPGIEVGAINFRNSDVTAEFGMDAYGFLGLPGEFRSQFIIAVTQSTDTGLNAIEMFESGDAGYMNVNNSVNENSISLNGENGVLSATGGLSIDDGTNRQVSAGIDNGSGNPYFWLFGDDGGNSSVNLEMNDDGSGDYGSIWVNNRFDVNEVRLNGSDGSISATGNVGSATSTLSVGDSRFVHLGANADFDTQLPYLFMSGDDNNGGNTEVIIRLFDDGAGDYGHIQLQDPSNTASITLNGKDGSGTFTGNVTSPNITLLSDRNLKENIRPLDHSLSNVLALRGVSYDWKNDKYGAENEIGIIAQEVEEVYPEFVYTGEDGIKSVNYSQMVAVLIESIKELNTMIEKLELENVELKVEISQFESLQTQVDQLQTMMNGLMNQNINSNEFQVTGQDK